MDLLFVLCLAQAFGGLVKVEMDPENSKNLIFSFRHAHLAQKVSLKHPALTCTCHVHVMCMYTIV